MPTINQLPVLNTISAGDQLPIYSPNNGDARRTSISSLLTYFQQTFASPTLSTNLYVPTTGFNITVPTPVSNDQWMLLQPAGTLATGTITLPLNTGVPDGTTVLITTTQEITSLTIALNGATAVFGGATSLAAGTGTVIRFYQSTNSWYLITGTTLSATTIDATGDITVKGNASAVKVRNSSNLGGGQISVVNAWNANADITSMAIGAITNLKFFTNNSVTESMTLDTSGNLTVPAMYATTVVAPRNVFIDSTGKMGGISSIRASKNNIAPITSDSGIIQFNPVTFQYRKRDKDGNYLEDVEGEIQYGLIAEEVEAINPDFCIYVDGKLAGVHYDRMVTPIIKVIQDQQALITNLTERLELLEAK